MRRKYLIYSFIAFLAWMILEKMDNEFKWIALGFGGAMLLFGVFMKEKLCNIDYSNDLAGDELLDEIDNQNEFDREVVANNLNKKESVIKE